MGKRLSFLKKKELGLPIWAWALIVSVGLFVLYRYVKNRNPSATPAAATPVQASDFTGTGAADDSGGGVSGGGADTSGDLSDQGLTGGLGGGSGGGYQRLRQGGGIDTGDTTPGAVAGMNPSGTTAIAGAGPLDWGGQQFTSRADFTSWLSGHGGSVAQFAVMHPAAYAKYLALPAGKTAKSVKSTTKSSPLSTKKSPVRSVVGGNKSVTKPVKTATPKKIKVPSKVSGMFNIDATVPGLRTTTLHPAAKVGPGKPAANKPAPKPVTKTKTPTKPAAKPTPVAIKQPAAKVAPKKPLKKR